MNKITLAALIALLVLIPISFAQFPQSNPNNAQGVGFSTSSNSGYSYGQSVNIGTVTQSESEFITLEQDQCSVKFKGLAIVSGKAYVGVIKQQSSGSDFIITVKLKKMELPDFGFPIPDSKLSVKFEGDARGNTSNGTFNVVLQLDQDGSVRTLNQKSFSFGDCGSFGGSFDPEQFLGSLTPSWGQLPEDVKEKIRQFHSSVQNSTNSTNRTNHTNQTDFIPEVKFAIEAAADAEIQSKQDDNFGYQVSKFFGLKRNEEIKAAAQLNADAAKLDAAARVAKDRPVLADLAAKYRAEAELRQKNARGVFSFFTSASANA